MEASLLNVHMFLLSQGVTSHLNSYYSYEMYLFVVVFRGTFLIHYCTAS